MPKVVSDQFIPENIESIVYVVEVFSVYASPIDQLGTARPTTSVGTLLEQFLGHFETV